jgi:hypothetical protein
MFPWIYRAATITGATVAFLAHGGVGLLCAIAATNTILYLHHRLTTQETAA